MKLYDGPKVIIGLVIFFVLFTSPFWLNLGKAVGKGAPIPEPKTDTPVIEEMADEYGQKQCVEEATWMKAKHMQLLNDWRNDVVRDADRIYTGENGVRFKMSLTDTCMDCHSNKAQFCDQCHNYASVTPYCWDCHIEPKEEDSDHE